MKQHLETSVVGVDVGVNVGVQILEYLRLNPGCRANAIANAIGTTTRTVERHIRQLREQGKIEFRGAPKTGGYYLQPEATTE
ncbi:MAG: winged helix-turn-helix domain-containing protein [Victivallales bacterium]|nr:winged helix-turn-helix domain-containing protein [Victivallales bacterium]